MRKYNKLIPVLSVVFLVLQSCNKDYLETKPTGAVTQSVIASSTADLAPTLQGSLIDIRDFGIGGYGGHDNYGQRSFDLVNDLMGTDMVVHSSGYGWYNRDYQYVEWSLPANNRRSDIVWTRFYLLIGQMNFILEVVDKAKGPEAEKQTIKGQALGLRAYAYFYLINYMQQTYKGNEMKPGVPLILDNSKADPVRGTVKAVYDQIVKDLAEAEKLLLDKSFNDKTAMDVHVVQGFRARTALLMEDWPTAALYAKKAYTYGSTPQLMTASQYREGFSKISNPEWMWGGYIPADQATIYASFFSHFDIKTGGYASLGQQKKITQDLYDKIAIGDVRKTVFQQASTLSPANGIYTSEITGYKTPNSTSPVFNQLKFRVPTPGSWAADYVYMRTAEMYLIEAEALVRSGNEGAAKTSLETLIKTRYPAYSISSLSGSALVAEILLQRRVELWGEGWSLIDIKRTNRGLARPSGNGNHGTPNLDPVVFTQPDASSRFLMRIPQRELDANPFMTANDQNP